MFRWLINDFSQNDPIPVHLNNRAVDIDPLDEAWQYQEAADNEGIMQY